MASVRSVTTLSALAPDSRFEEQESCWITEWIIGMPLRCIELLVRCAGLLRDAV